MNGSHLIAIAIVALANAVFASADGGYQRLSYIGGDGINNNGNQWVNSGYVPKCTDRIEAKIRMRSIERAQGLYCTRTTANQDVFACIMPSAHLGHWRFDRNGDNVNGLSDLKLNTTDTYVIVADYNSCKCTINGAYEVTMASGNYTCPGPLAIGAVYNGSTPSTIQNPGEFDLYYFRIYDRYGNLVREYLPAYDKSDETVAKYGLFETQTGVFCSNQSTTKAFHIGANDLVKTFDVADIPVQIVDRSAAAPMVVVVDPKSGTTLAMGTHYSVSYLNADVAGTAVAVITGIAESEYEGVTVYKPFEVVRSRLPEGYRRVPYIESTASGNQWINTGYIPKGTDRLEMKVRFADVDNNADGVYCSRLSSTEDFFLCVAPSADKKHLRFDRNKVKGESSSVARKTGVDSFVVADGKTLECTINGVSAATMADGAFVPAGPLSLFVLYTGAAPTADSLSNYGQFKLYWFRVYDETGDLVREYVPALDESVESGSALKYGLFETVRGSFHPNCGTATFKAGDVEAEPSVEGRFSVADIPPQILKRAQPCEPEVEVADLVTGKVLVKGVDFIVTYRDNDRSGAAAAMVKGLPGSDYEGFSVVVPFVVSYRKLRGNYQRMVSISSTKDGKQWIDTGYIPSCTDRFEIGLTIDSIEAQGLYCTREAANSKTLTCVMPSANLGYFRFCRNADNSSAESLSVHEFHVKARYDFVVDGQTLECSVNGVKTAQMSAGTFTPPKPLALFAIYQANTSEMMNFARMTLYYFRAWGSDGKLKHEFVPSRDTEAEEGAVEQCGLYDTVSGTFHPNKGVAAFKHGEDEVYIPGPMPGFLLLLN